MGCRVERGATGSHLIATVNCHSSFLLPCYPPPWTNIPPRQFRRATTNQLSSSRSQIRSSIVQIPAFHSPTIITQPMSSQHFSHPADLTPALSQPRPDITFHLRHSILPLSTSFAPPHHAASRKHKPFLKVVLGGAGVCPVKREFAHAAHGRYYPLRSSNKTFSTM